MGTYQPSLLTHFAVTEDMPGRRRKNNDGQKAVGSDAPAPAPAPAGAHGLVRAPPQGLGKGMAAQGNSESWNQVKGNPKQRV